MEPITYNIRLDASQAGVQATVNAKRGDARMRRVVVHLYSGSTPYSLPEAGAGATLWANKPDGTRVFKNCEIEGDRITVTLTSNMLAAVGLVNCELQVLGSDGALLTSPRFDVSVEDALMNDGLVESTDEFTALTEALVRVEDIEESEVERAEAEEQRAAAEAERAAAEAARDEAEQTRITAEGGRAAAESARAAAEEARVLSEKARADAEAARVLAENARVAAENARVVAESNRVTAEESREATVSATLGEIEERTDNAIAANAEATQAAITANNEAARAAVEQAETAAQGADAAATAADEAAQTANDSAALADAATERANKAAKACEDIVVGLDITWDALQDKPETFPPSPHNHQITDVIGLTDALDGKANITQDYSATLTASGWAGTAAPYEQTVAVEAVTADSSGSVGVAEGATDAEFTAALEAQLRKTAQAAGSMTFKAYGDKPSVDIPITVSIEVDA